MNDNKVHFKQALKKQIWTISVVSICFMIFTFSMNVKSDLHFYIWLILFTTTSYIVFALLKKQSKEALCPHCKSDLFEIIEISKSIKLDFNFCPSCGEKVEI